MEFSLGGPDDRLSGVRGARCDDPLPLLRFWITVNPEAWCQTACTLLGKAEQ